MRFLSAVLLLLVAATVRADRLVTIPVGKKVLNRTFRIEGLFDPADWGRGRFSLAAGLTQNIDAEIYHDRLSSGRNFTSFDVAYNQSAPITDLTPGISVGLLDALNETELGRRLFGAITFRVGLQGDTVNDVPLEVTIGAATNVRHPIFVGVLLPFSPSYRILAEHDGERITAGFEFRPGPGVVARALFRRDRTLVSLSLTHRF